MDPLTRYNDEYKQAQRERIVTLEAEIAQLKEQVNEAWAQLGDTQIDLALAQNEMRCMGLRMDELRDAAAKFIEAFEEAESIHENFVMGEGTDADCTNAEFETAARLSALRALLHAGADNG